MLSLFAEILRAFVIGFLISIPMGPVGVLTMHRSATYGWRAGLIAIIPVFTIDTIAAFIFLLDSPAAFIRKYHFPHWFSIVGALVLLIYGIIMYRNAVLPPKHSHLTWQRNFFTSLVVAITNPSAYLGYAAVAILLSRFNALALPTRIGIAIAYCMGAFLWWMLLITIAAIQQNHTRSKVIMQRVASVIMMIVALVMVLPPRRILYFIKLISERL